MKPFELRTSLQRVSKGGNSTERVPIDVRCETSLAKFVFGDRLMEYCSDYMQQQVGCAEMAGWGWGESVLILRAVFYADALFDIETSSSLRHVVMGDQ